MTTLSFGNRRGPDLAGYTLLEILLAIGLGAILAFASVPAMSGWMAEHRLRAQADALIQFVQSVKLDAERSGRFRAVVLLPPGGRAPDEVPEGVRIFELPPGSRWSLKSFSADGGGRPTDVIRIDARGRVVPVSFRVDADGRHLEYRFDFLTGHAEEVASSF